MWELLKASRRRGLPVEALLSLGRCHAIPISDDAHVRIVSPGCHHGRMVRSVGRREGGMRIRAWVLNLSHVRWESTRRRWLRGGLQSGRGTGLVSSQGRVDGRVHLKGEDALNVSWIRRMLVRLIVVCAVHFAGEATGTRQLQCDDALLWCGSIGCGRVVDGRKVSVEGKE